MCEFCVDMVLKSMLQLSAKAQRKVFSADKHGILVEEKTFLKLESSILLKPLQKNLHPSKFCL